MKQVNTMRKIGIGAIVLAALGCWISACGEDTKKNVQKEVVRPAKIFTIFASSQAFSREFPGEVRASQQVDMSFNIPGTLVKLPVKEGQQVKEGDLIAAIDSRDLRNTLAAERAKLRDSKASYERHKGLLAEQVTTQAEFDKVERM